jgi:hypothetical protein
MKIIHSVLALLLLVPLSVQAAVVSIDRPPGFLIGAPVGVDFNNDSIDDGVVRFYDPICVSGGSVSSCTNGATITFSSNVELYGSIVSGQLIPSYLAAGALLGPTTPTSDWIPTGGLALDLIYRFGSQSLPNEGYPDYAQSLERMFIGFRVIEGSEYRYGWIDVQLTDPPQLPDRLQMSFPEFNGAYIGDSPQQSVVVFPVPEPSLICLLLGGSMLMILRRNRNSRGEQDVGEQPLLALLSAKSRVIFTLYPRSEVGSR